MSKQTGDSVDLTIFVPCYNEEGSIGKTLDNIREAAADFSFSYEVLIYNDGSTDHTREVAQDYIATNHLEDTCSVISNETNRGIGVNYFSAAKRGSGEYYIVFFGDNSEPVESMQKMFDLMGHADIIIPYIDSRFFDSRFNTDKRVFIRRFFSINFARLVRLLSGYKISYFNGFVLHRRQNVIRHEITAYGLGYQAELLCRILDESDANYLEIRVSCADRTSGIPTAFKPRNVVSVIGSLLRILRQRLKTSARIRQQKKN